MSKWKSIPLGEILSQYSPPLVEPEPTETIKFAGVRWYGKGLFIREERLGSEVGKCYALKPGTLIYNRLFAWKQSFGVVTDDYQNVVVSNEFPQFDVDLEQATPAFLSLYCSSPLFADLALSLSSGSAAVSRNRLKEKDFLSLPAVLPPLGAQKQITEIIESVDHVHDSITREMIAAKNARAALLDKLLDVLPITAETTTLGEAARWSSGGTPKADNPAYYDGNIPWAVIGDVRERSIRYTTRKITPQGLDAIGGEKKLVPERTVLVTMYGTIGNCAVTEVPMATNQAICRGIPREGVDPDYLRLWISAKQANLISLGEGKTQVNINKKKIENFPIVIPDSNSQRELVQVMESVDDQIEALEKEAHQTAALRETLLTELLTGDTDPITPITGSTGEQGSDEE